MGFPGVSANLGEAEGRLGPEDEREGVREGFLGLILDLLLGDAASINPLRTLSYCIQSSFILSMVLLYPIYSCVNGFR